MRVALYGKNTNQKDTDNAVSLIKELEKKNISIGIEKEFYDSLQRDYKGHPVSNQYKIFSKSSDIKGEYDIFISIGGDGTLLKAATYVYDSGIPIFGINTGRLGFLASFQQEQFIQSLDKFLQNDFEVSQRSLITLKNVINEDLTYNFALNEIAISRKETTSMISIKAYIGEQYLNTFWADGLIVSTPTGSTGYSLSCGGPIISPENASFVITPIAPHNLNVRPIIIPDNEKLTLTIESRADEYYISLDSRLASFPKEQKLELELANFKILLAKNNQMPYLETLRHKLFWGRDSRE